MIAAASCQARARRHYDHRLRDLVCRTGDASAAGDLFIPASTVRSWMARGSREVVTAERLSLDHGELVARVAQLERTVSSLRAACRLLLVLVRMLAPRHPFRYRRLPDGVGQQRLRTAIEDARRFVGLARVLRFLGLSASRYHEWGQAPCAGSPTARCRRRHPQRVSAAEIAEMTAMATDPGYRHVPLGTLARLAMRLGRVFVAPATWRRLARQLNWDRPRRRIYPAKPRVGIRAERPAGGLGADPTALNCSVSLAPTRPADKEFPRRRSTLASPAPPRSTPRSRR